MSKSPTPSGGALPLAAAAAVAIAVAAVTQPPPPKVMTSVVSAYFNPGRASAAFFQSSPDLVNWQTFAQFDYPTNGDWLSATNVSKTRAQFFRAGYTP